MGHPAKLVEDARYFEALEIRWERPVCPQVSNFSLWGLRSEWLLRLMKRGRTCLLVVMNQCRSHSRTVCCVSINLQ